MLLWTLALLALAMTAGWQIASRFHCSRLFRALLTPGLGLSFCFSLFCLFDRFLPLAASLGLSTLGLLALAAFATKLPSLALEESEPSRAQLGFILFLSFTALFYSQGFTNLGPGLDFLLWDLPFDQPGTRSAFRAASSFLSSDPWLATQLLAMLCQVSVVMASFSAFRHLLPQGNLPWFGSALYLLGCSHNSWLVFQTPKDTLVHLFGVSSLLFLLVPEKRLKILALPGLLALSTLHRPLALALLLSIDYWGRRPSIVLSLAGIAVQCYFNTLSLEMLAASGYAFYLLRTAPTPKPLHLQLILLGLLTPGMGWLGLVPLAAELGERLEKQWKSLEAGSFSLTAKGLVIPKRVALMTAALALFWFGIDGAEGELNDRVLIGAQKEKVAHLKLLPPRSLKSWLELRGQAFGFGIREHQVMEQAKSLAGSFVYLSGTLPDPRPAALLALATGKPFLGWSPTGKPKQAALAYPLALFQGTAKSETLAGTPADWLLQPESEPIKVSGGTAPTGVGLTVYLDGRHGLPSAKDSLLTARLAPSQTRWIDAASLVPVGLELSNPTGYTLEMDSVKGIVLGASFPVHSPGRPETQPRNPLTLPPLAAGERVVVTGFLRTNNLPLDYTLRPALTRADGSTQPLTPSEPIELRTRRIALPLDPPFGAEE